MWCEWLICHVGECACYLDLPLAPSLFNNSQGRVTLWSSERPHLIPAHHGTAFSLPVVQRPLGGPCQVLCSLCSSCLRLASCQIGVLPMRTLWGGTGSTRMLGPAAQTEFQSGKRFWPRSWECELGAN